MNKAELVDVVSQVCSTSRKDAENVVDVILDEIVKTLQKGEEVKISNFGVFTVRHKKERLGTVPGTDKKITIPSAKTVSFKPSKNLKDSIN
jgi:nucleoid DNA-binding protein